MDVTVPEIRISQTQTQPEPGTAPAQGPAAVKEHSAVRRFLLSRGNSAIADGGFKVLMVLCALSIFGIVLLIATELVRSSSLTWKAFGLQFFYSAYIDPVHRPAYLLGSRSTATSAPCLSSTEHWFLRSWRCCWRCRWPLASPSSSPKCARGFCAAPLAFLTELLAAIPSIIYGLWAVFVLVPLLREYVNPVLAGALGWTGFFSDDNPTGLGYVTAAVILAIMILPIISSLTREVMTAVPHSQREAVLALGATRWEMIRMGVLRNARIGIVGAIILGLGRALGETMAVTMVIGNTPEIHRSLLSNGATMASVIANEFTEAVSDMH